MNYVVTGNEVSYCCTKINHIQLYVEQVAKCRIESGEKRAINENVDTVSIDD